MSKDILTTLLSLLITKEVFVGYATVYRPVFQVILADFANNVILNKC